MNDMVISANNGYMLVKRAQFYGIITPKTDVWFNTLEEACAFIEGISKLWAK